jgi:hypothetical protein
MPVGPDQQRLNPDERANLVAFIDGELTENESRVLNTKLTHSVTARREVELLKKTWELLDHLPRPRVSEQFSERTLTNIKSLELKGESWNSATQAWASRGVRFAVPLVVASLSLALGFAVSRWVWPEPDLKMARNLTLAEHLDEYLDVNSFEFLEELAGSQEFSPKLP